MFKKLSQWIRQSKTDRTTAGVVELIDWMYEEFYPMMCKQTEEPHHVVCVRLEGVVYVLRGSTVNDFKVVLDKVHNLLYKRKFINRVEHAVYISRLVENVR